MFSCSHVLQRVIDWILKVVLLFSGGLGRKRQRGYAETGRLWPRVRSNRTFASGLRNANLRGAGNSNGNWIRTEGNDCT